MKAYVAIALVPILFLPAPTMAKQKLEVVSADAKYYDESLKNCNNGYHRGYVTFRFGFNGPIESLQDGTVYLGNVKYPINLGQPERDTRAIGYGICQHAEMPGPVSVNVKIADKTGAVVFEKELVYSVNHAPMISHIRSRFISDDCASVTGEYGDFRSEGGYLLPPENLDGGYLYLRGVSDSGVNATVFPIDKKNIDSKTFKVEFCSPILHQKQVYFRISDKFGNLSFESQIFPEGP
jgi:hypothetical protein